MWNKQGKGRGLDLSFCHIWLRLHTSCSAAHVEGGPARNLGSFQRRADRRWKKRGRVGRVGEGWWARSKGRAKCREMWSMQNIVSCSLSVGRKAHFRFTPKWWEVKQLDHTGSTLCPKPDFNYHFPQQVHTAWLQTKYLFLFDNILTYFRRGNVFSGGGGVLVLRPIRFVTGSLVWYILSGTYLPLGVSSCAYMPSAHTFILT